MPSHLKRYTKELEARRINQLFSTEPSKVQYGKLVELRADGNLSEQVPVTITVADISSMKVWTAPGPDMSHTSCLKKLTTFDEYLAA